MAVPALARTRVSAHVQSVVSRGVHAAWQLEDKYLSSVLEEVATLPRWPSLPCPAAHKSYIACVDGHVLKTRSEPGNTLPAELHKHSYRLLHRREEKMFGCRVPQTQPCLALQRKSPARQKTNVASRVRYARTSRRRCLRTCSSREVADVKRPLQVLSVRDRARVACMLCSLKMLLHSPSRLLSRRAGDQPPSTGDNNRKRAFVTRGTMRATAAPVTAPRATAAPATAPRATLSPV